MDSQHNLSEMIGTSVFPDSKKSQFVLVTTFTNQHLSAQTTPLGPTLTLQTGTDKLHQETFLLRTERVLLHNADVTSLLLVSLEKKINQVTYYVTVQETTEEIKLQQFPERPDPAHPDGRLFILEMANTYCFLQSWKRRGLYVKDNKSTITIQKRVDRKQFLFDFLPLRVENDCIKNPET
ncbi:uncharacterized protein LOC121374976 [Gigantopelta aegis]|uniref:uncharacterized protein LOC121374976 n=1 Tax=Gigantopelta aegis TaxID=1735272 RepID=UPI001B887883|nr:uncharacterized protein LOC121374976 [Gigantopelta aegis]